MNTIETITSLPGLYRQTKLERLDRVEIPLGWVRSIESLRGYGKNLTMLLGTSGSGRDTLLEAIQAINPSYDRIKRVTTRENRSDKEQTRISSIDLETFINESKQSTIVSAYKYPVNDQFYGIRLTELAKLTIGPGLLEGTTELLPLKILFPDAKLFVVLPQSFTQIDAQLTKRDSWTRESQARSRQTKRELCSLVCRLEQLIELRLVDGVITNAPPADLAAQNGYAIVSGQTVNFSIPERLISDILDYLSLWRKYE